MFAFERKPRPAGAQPAAEKPAHRLEAAKEAVRTAGQGGVPMPPALRSFFEPRFGYDFSSVRIHHGGRAAESARALQARAYTLGRDVVFGAGEYRPGTSVGRRLLAHELTHVVQQDAGRHLQAGMPRIQRQASAPGTQTTAPAPPAPAAPRRLEIEVVGSDANLDEPLAVMANRWAAQNRGQVIRVSSLEDTMRQLRGLATAGACLGRLNVWYHGSPEIQLVVGEYAIGRARQRLPASGFSRDWLAQESNREALSRFRGLFCCNGLMHWFGCGTATVRASGGLRTPDELNDPRSIAHPDVYSSAEAARAHGASLSGASFGRVNVQSWADATCTTVRSATDFVELRPESRRPITIARGGQWTDTPPRGQCGCDPATGRVAGPAPSRAEIVRGAQEQIAGLVGGDLLWHQNLTSLRAALPRETEIVGSGGSTTSTIVPGTLPARLREEMTHRVGDRRGPLERQYADQINTLLHLAGQGIAPPAPLQNVPMPPRLFIRIRVGGTWAAVTQPHLAAVRRNDFWHWIVFNDAAISETPQMTRTLIEHELQHAADHETHLREFEASHPRPTSTPPEAYGRPAEASTVRGWNDEWGRYINAYIAFHEGRLRPDRHLEIILGQRRGYGSASTWDRWSAEERAYWFELVFNHLPPDVPAGTALTGEDEVIRAFETANPSLQAAAVQRAYDALEAGLHPEPTLPASEVEPRRANARTLVQHFGPILTRVFQAHPLLTAATALRLLRQPPGRSL